MVENIEPMDLVKVDELVTSVGFIVSKPLLRTFVSLDAATKERLSVNV